MSESNFGFSSYSGESRSSSVRGFNSFSSSESRSSSEGRKEVKYSSKSSESRDFGESRESLYEPSTSSYNNLEDIDKLIESLEANIPVISSDNARFNAALEVRKAQIAELKSLKEQAKKSIEVEKQIQQLEKMNKETQKAIDTFRRNLNLNSQPTRKRNTRTGESRNSGESRY